MIYVGSLDNLFFLAFLPFVFVRLRLIMVDKLRCDRIWPSDHAGRSILCISRRGIDSLSHFSFQYLSLLRSMLGKKGRFDSGWLVDFDRPCFCGTLSPHVCGISFRSDPHNLATHVFADGVFPGLQTKAFIPAAFALGQEFPGVTTAWPDLLLSIASGRIYHFRPVAMAANPPSILLVICMLFSDSSLARCAGAPQLRNL